MIKNTNIKIYKDSEILVKGVENMSDKFIDEMNKEIVANDESVSGNLSEVVQSLDRLQGKGTPSEIAKVMFGTSNPTGKEKRKVRNICQNKGLSSDKGRIIPIENGRYLLLKKNTNGREKNLYLVAKDKTHAKQLNKQG